MREIASGLHFPEGPVALADGSVLVVEIQSGTLARVGPDGSVERVADTGGGPNGAAIGPDGKVYVCNNGGFLWAEVDGMAAPGGQPPDYIGGRIQRVDLDTGQVDDLYTEYEGVGLRGPNDLVFDEHGGFYFTDLGKSREREIDRGAVYYAKADGSEIVRLVFPLDHPNGIALSPDGTRLYVAETITGRIWTWRLGRSRRGGTGRPRRSARARCSTASTASSCSTRWPSTARGTSAWRPWSPGRSAWCHPTASCSSRSRCRSTTSS